MTRTFCEIALVQNCEMKSWISRVNAIYVHPCLQNKVTFNLFLPGVFLPPKVFWISRTPSVDVTQQCLICSTDHLRVFGKSFSCILAFIHLIKHRHMLSFLPLPKNLVFSLSLPRRGDLLTWKRNMGRQIQNAELRLVAISAEIMLHSASSRNFHLSFCFPVAAADSYGLKSCDASLPVTHM